jgi:hypothetical protein
MRPRVHAGVITFTIVPPKGTKITKEVYGVFHGRFTEMLLTHFDTQISNVTASSMPAFGDVVSGS